MNPVKSLENHGQAVWLDFLARGFVAKGDLKKLIDTDGVKGVTSNPSIFEKAIGSSDEYDKPIGQALERVIGRSPNCSSTSPSRISSTRPTYCARSTIIHGGHDGFVSLEVSPYLAMDTKGFGRGGRAALERGRSQKSDGQGAGDCAGPAGDPAADRRRHQHQHHPAVFAESLCPGRRGLSGGPGKIHRQRRRSLPVASVASFFVSRIDSAVDKQLDEKIAQANDPTEKERLAALKGKIAIANAKLAYQDYKRLFSGARWDKLAAKGAKPQRLLWASTGTKNKDYSDVLYVEELIGPNTVNTVPPATLDAFRDHGKPRNSLEENIDEAKDILGELEKSGISLDAITAELVKDGVKQFAEPPTSCYGAVAHKRATVLGAGIDAQMLALGSSLGKAVEGSTEDWRASAKIRALWNRDKSVWTGSDENKWLGWLTASPQPMSPTTRISRMRVKGQNFTDAVVLGMGGSSLGPEVLAKPSAGSRASRNCMSWIRPILRRSADWRPRSSSPTRCSSSPANPAAPPNPT